MSVRLDHQVGVIIRIFHRRSTLIGSAECFESSKLSKIFVRMIEEAMAETKSKINKQTKDYFWRQKDLERSEWP